MLLLLVVSNDSTKHSNGDDVIPIADEAPAEGLAVENDLKGLNDC